LGSERRKMREEEIEQELENNEADIVFPINEGYVKVENIERVRDVIISKSVRVSKLIEESELKGKTFKAEITIKDNVTLIRLLVEEKEKNKEGAQAFFSPVISSPKQRITFKNWEAIGTTSMGRIYKEVVDRMLGEYKDGVEPPFKTFTKIIQEMYGEHLKESSLKSYASIYKRYIVENKLAVELPAKELKTNNLHIGEPIVKVHKKEFKPKIKELLPIEKVCEIWNLLPDEFTYKQVKALIPAGTMQSGVRIDATNYTLREFKRNPAFECEETSPGMFKKSKAEK
jgi:hypothetical protein